MIKRAPRQKQLNLICPLCERALDLNNVILPTADGYAHYHCHVFSEYQNLVNIAGGLINAIENDEEIDLDQLREDLIEALGTIHGTA